MCVGSLESNEFNQDGLSFSIGTRSDGLTALMLAAVAGHSAAVRALLAGGVALDTEEEAPDGMPPSTAGNHPVPTPPSTHGLRVHRNSTRLVILKSSPATVCQMLKIRLLSTDSR